MSRSVLLSTERKANMVNISFVCIDESNIKIAFNFFLIDKTSNIGFS
jgi:hypothetical protein